MSLPKTLKIKSTDLTQRRSSQKWRKEERGGNGQAGRPWWSAVVAG